jgi:REP element-mobilizing transposase RayT
MSRENLISEKIRERIHKYITGIVHNKGQKLLAVYCMSDHIHIFCNLQPDIDVSSFVRDIKSNSSKFINKYKLASSTFYWQRGFGAFSHSTSQIDAVIKYILNQEAHHRKRDYKNEYLEILNKNKVKYDSKYVCDK